MKIIFASSFNNTAKDENGKKYAVAISDANHFLTNLRKYTPKFDCVIIVANDPTDFETTDLYANLLFQSLKMSGLDFKTKIVFDNRNKNQAKEIFAKTDLIFLSGGEVGVQNVFFKNIKMGELLRSSMGLVVGGSAGAMNLCKTVLCFPNFIKGIGLWDKIIIPHFDGANKHYWRNDNDKYNELMDLSVGRELIGIDDSSYLLLTDKEVRPFGNIYRIINRICQRFE
jgi:hypothetical protein